MAKRKWSISVIVLYAATMILPSMDRYLTWDEAVFWSQSGGVDGAPAQPLPLVASRELGSSFLIRILRFFGDDIAEVRFLWATLAFFVLVVGARYLARLIGDRGALTFLWIYGTHWLVLAWTPAFYSNVLAAGFALLAAVIYLELIREEDADVWRSIWFGLAIAAAFAMRPLEALLVVLGLAIHFLVFNWRKVRPLLGKAAVSLGVALVAVGIPWTIDSINRFGSVAERIESGLSQGGQVASGLRSNVVEYLGVLSGDRVEALPGGPVPYWPRYFIFGVAIVCAIVIGLALARKGISAIQESPGLFLLLSAINASFFLFWREAVNERYFFVAMVFAAALFGWALDYLLSEAPLIRTKMIIGVAALIWLIPQMVTVSAYEESRELSSERAGRIAATMRTLANGLPCDVMSRYGTPQLHVASGCEAKLYVDWQDAADFAQETTNDVPTFIYGPDRDGHFEGLPSDWKVVPVDGFKLAYSIPDYESEPN